MEVGGEVAEGSPAAFHPDVDDLVAASSSAGMRSQTMAAAPLERRRHVLVAVHGAGPATKQPNGLTCRLSATTVPPMWVDPATSVIRAP